MRREVIVQHHAEGSDCIVDKDNLIVKDYRENYAKRMSFRNYFYTMQNPDLSPVGFLEELDRLLQLPRVVLSHKGVSEFASYCATIKKYLEFSK